MRNDNIEAWSKFRKRITINADSQVIYDAVATQNGLESWFLRKAEFLTSDGRRRRGDEHIQKNDDYYWLWHGYDDQVFEKRKVLESNGRNFLQFEFTGGCTVSIRIKKASGENFLELIQEGIEYDENPYRNLFVMCGEGWTFYLSNLKSIIEGGIDLRNRNKDIQNLINA